MNTFLNKYEEKLPNHMRDTFKRLEQPVFLDLEQMIGANFMTRWWRIQPFFVHYMDFLDRAEKQWKTIQKSLQRDFVTPSVEQLPRANFPEDVIPENHGINLVKESLNQTMSGYDPYAQFGILSPRDFWLDGKNGFKPEPHESLVYAYAIHHTLLFYQLCILCTWPGTCEAYDGSKPAAHLLSTRAKLPGAHVQGLLKLISNRSRMRTLDRNLEVWGKTETYAKKLHRLCVKEDDKSRDLVKEHMIASFLPEDWPPIIKYMTANQIQHSTLYEELLGSTISQAPQTTELTAKMDLEEEEEVESIPQERVLMAVFPPQRKWSQRIRHRSERGITAASTSAPQATSRADSPRSTALHSVQTASTEMLTFGHKYRTPNDRISESSSDNGAESSLPAHSSAPQHPNPQTKSSILLHASSKANPKASTVTATPAPAATTTFGADSSLWIASQPQVDGQARKPPLKEVKPRKVKNKKRRTNKDEDKDEDEYEDEDEDDNEDEDGDDVQTQKKSARAEASKRSQRRSKRSIATQTDPVNWDPCSGMPPPFILDDSLWALLRTLHITEQDRPRFSAYNLRQNNALFRTSPADGTS
jgi:hypothetical protein